MKVTVLVDNKTLIDRYFLAEPGVSFYIEERENKILFDVGYSDIFLTNGEKMGLGFFDLDALVISHSHVDHTWGLEPLIKRLSEEIMEGRSFKKPRLVAHPGIFDSRTFTGVEEIGMNVDKDRLMRYVEDEASVEPNWITDRLVFLGQIPRSNDFEAKSPIGKVTIDGRDEDDYILEDSALCYKSDEGLVIITGCSHAGICNIVEHAKKVCSDNRIVDVIGGFHLQDPPKEVLEKTVAYFQSLGVKKIHACHCTDLRSIIALSSVVEVGDVGVGMQLEY